MSEIILPEVMLLEVILLEAILLKVILLLKLVIASISDRCINYILEYFSTQLNHRLGFAR